MSAEARRFYLFESCVAKKLGKKLRFAFMTFKENEVFICRTAAVAILRRSSKFLLFTTVLPVFRSFHHN
ncbi:hypothetical protein L596_004115 [Steinernema carpocapsae]|uniref:Uncharacterized protein n=1 Tax=Steinernema carpocapsae TaxID=34508 RepID=A0A4U8UVT6_STECR|nr:hypothetical protein L596_004115 [Steinernema carpocapsae]